MYINKNFPCGFIFGHGKFTAAKETMMQQQEQVDGDEVLRESLTDTIEACVQRWSREIVKDAQNGDASQMFLLGTLLFRKQVKIVLSS